MAEFYINHNPHRTSADELLLTDLVDWYRGEIEDIARKDAATEQALQTALLTGVEIGQELESVKLIRSGRVTTLQGLVAFLAT